MFGVHYHTQSQTVILEVLSVGDVVIGQGGVGDELMTTPFMFANVSLSYTNTVGIQAL